VKRHVSMEQLNISRIKHLPVTEGAHQRSKGALPAFHIIGMQVAEEQE